MVEGLDTFLWVMGIVFVVCWFFRLWWVAALITAGVVAMAIQGAGADLQLNILLFGVLATGVAAFGGAALGKFLHKHNTDPFDPTSKLRKRDN